MSCNCEFIKTKELTKVDYKKDNIYYLYDYYKKWWMDNYPTKQYYRDNFFSFIMLKKDNYESRKSSLHFHAAAKNFIDLLEGDWIVCTAPGHEKTTNTHNAVCGIIEDIDYGSNISLRNTLIQRAFTVDKKSQSSNRVMNPDEDIKSLTLDISINISGKNVLVIDDITTTGCTLTACRNLLLKNGAKNVVCLAFGKTKEYIFYGC